MDDNILDDITNDVDRISDLPEVIVHHILSLLDSPVELVRMSVLSNYWFSVTASFPILDFNCGTFINVNGPPTLDMFFKYVEYTTSRFCQQNLTSAHTFKLIIDLKEPTHLDITNRCLGLILNKGVQVLFVDISIDYLPIYCMPNILLSVSTLTSLTICGCELPSSLMVDAVKFKFLKLLCLEGVPVNDEVIKRLTTICPLLEEFNLMFCYGCKIFCVYGYQNLQKVEIYDTYGVERLDIEAPNLSYLIFVNRKISGAPSMNLASCNKLTKVSYHGIPPPCNDLLSNFPFIENLLLRLPMYHKNLKFTSSSLRTFVLQSECDLEEIDFHTPNLLLFLFNSRFVIPDPLAIDSALFKTTMECYPEDDVDALWFQKLRRFLDKNNAFKVLKLHISTKLIYVEELNMIQLPPYELEHVELELETIKDLSVYVAVVDAVLWCCRPRSLTLRSNFSIISYKKRSHVVKFTYKKLREQEDEGQTNIQIVLSSSSKAKKYFSDLNSLLTASSRNQLTQTITFIKEEVL